MFGIIFVSSIAAMIRGYLFNSTSDLIARHLRYDIVYFLLCKDVAFFDENLTGNLISRIAGDTEVVCHGMSTNISMAVRSGLFIIGSLAFMIIISWEMTLVALGSILTIAIFFKFQR